MTANVILTKRLRAAKGAVEMDRATARKWGMRIAERDFANGHPACYVTGRFNMNGLGNPPTLPGKPGRVVVGLGCVVFPGDESFVRSYNERMDALFAARQQSEISKP
jgi:hypothetical protein